MISWQLDQLDALSSPRSEAELLGTLTRFVRELGFEFCAYGARPPVPVAPPRTVMFNNYPEAWQLAYVNNDYLHVDPSVRRGLCSVAPFTWSGEVTRAEPAFWEHASSYGIRHGWAQTIRDHYGCVGMLSLSRSADSITAQELKQYEPRMMWLTQMAHHGFTTLMPETLHPNHDAALSAREIEVIKLTADGKSAEEISDILYIAVSTVDHHLSTIIEKLHASNKTTAVIRAAMMGILS